MFWRRLRGFDAWSSDGRRISQWYKVVGLGEQLLLWIEGREERRLIANELLGAERRECQRSSAVEQHDVVLEGLLVVTQARMQRSMLRAARWSGGAHSVVVGGWYRRRGRRRRRGMIEVVEVARVEVAIATRGIEIHPTRRSTL